MGDAIEEDEFDDMDELGYREIEIREQDRFLPIANIARIMKKVLPSNAKIAKDAKESIQECVSEFISFITSEASEKCQQEKRKTINGDDILWAMSTLGFDKYVEPLKIYLLKYRDSVKGEKPEKKSLTNKKNNDYQAQPKRSGLDDMNYHHSRLLPSSYQHQPSSYQQQQHHQPQQHHHQQHHHQGYNPAAMGGMSMGYPSSSSYGSVTSVPSGLSFMVDHSAPQVAPSKGEPGHVALPPPPPMNHQPPLSLSSMTSPPPMAMTMTSSSYLHSPNMPPSLNLNLPVLPPPLSSNTIGQPSHLLPQPGHVKLETHTQNAQFQEQYSSNVNLDPNQPYL